MFAYLKADPASYIILYSKGRKKQSGRGLSFFYFRPTSTLLKIPMNSTDVPFMFEEISADYQDITVQGQLTYRIADAEKAAEVLDYSLSGNSYKSEDPKKINIRLVNRIKVFIKEELQQQKLTACLQAAEALSSSLCAKLTTCSLVKNLGLEILDFNILALKPNPETFRALEAKVREELLKNADEARYSRRNASVEQERAIKENEFNTEIAIENKKKEVEETKLKARRELQEQDFMLRNQELSSGIELEEKNKELVGLETHNEKLKASAKAYGVEVLMKAYEKIDPKVIQALSMVNMDSPQIIANAFNELAANAGKIGELNISPELLNELVKKKRNR